jgi:hypothetical protein
LNKEKYNQFIDSIELIEEFVPEFSWERHIKDINPKKKINIEMKFNKEEPEISDNIFICGNSLELNGIDSNKELQFKIKGTILLRIFCNTNLTEECVKFYSENTVQYSTIPAFRSLVKEGLTKMGLPPFTLPFLKRRSQSQKDVLHRMDTLQTENKNFDDSKFQELLTLIKKLNRNSNGHYELYTKKQKQLNIIRLGPNTIEVATKKDWNVFNKIPINMINHTYEALRKNDQLTQSEISKGLNIKRSAFIIAALDLLPEIEYDETTNSLRFLD